MRADLRRWPTCGAPDASSLVSMETGACFDAQLQVSMDSSINTVVAENCSLKIMEFQVLAIGHSRMGSSMIKGRDGTRASRYPGAG